MIVHGMLSSHGTFDSLIHEMNQITEKDAKRESKKIDWKETHVFDNSNRGRLR